MIKSARYPKIAVCCNLKKNIDLSLGELVETGCLEILNQWLSKFSFNFMDLARFINFLKKLTLWSAPSFADYTIMFKQILY